MYNRYLPREETYAPVSETISDHNQYSRPEPAAQATQDGFGKIFSALGGGFELGKWKGLLDGDKFGGLDQLLTLLHLENLDSGDILLILIILLLLVEGDNLELVITLGLMLLLGLGDEKKKSPDSVGLSGDQER